MAKTTSELFDLTGKVALVTGGSGDMGRAIALMLAEHGADVAVTGRTQDALGETHRRLEATGRRALRIPADISLQSIRPPRRP